MNPKNRLDQTLVSRGLVATRSQAESWIKLGKVTVNGTVVTKPGFFVTNQSNINLKAPEQYVSRAGLKLASVAVALKLDFSDKITLDVGSSTGGFTDYALQRGASKVIAVDVGTDQLHPRLRSSKQVELFEKTDIRSVYIDTGSPLKWSQRQGEKVVVPYVPDIVVIDVSFISLRDILPHIAENLSGPQTRIVAMVKPQFEAGKLQVNKGIIKNDSVRRDILKSFEQWAKQYFIITDKADSEVAGSKGNRERFYLLAPQKKA